MRDQRASNTILDQLANLLTEILPTHLGIARSALLVLDEDSGDFSSIDAEGLRLSLDHPLVHHFQEDNTPILSAEHGENLAPAVTAFLEENGIEWCAPLKADQDLDGIYMLGPRSSGASYSQEEMSLLDVVAQQASMLLENERRYHEIESHGYRLEPQHAQALAAGDDSAAEQRNMLDTVLLSIADGLVVTNPDGDILFTNPAFDQMLPDPSASIQGQPLAHVIPVPELLAIVMDAFEAPDAVYTTDITLSDSRVFRASACGFGLGAGQRPGVVTVLRDITRDVEVDRMKTSFVAMVSHELRTPLSAILGFSEMLKENVYGPLSEEQTAIVERIMANGDRLLRIVTDLLDLTRIAAGTLTLTVQPFSPAELLDDVLGGMSGQAEAKGLALSGDLDDDVPAELAGDAGRLNQILVNLVENALKFTEEGGVNLRIYCPDAGHWAMAVSDTGPGIPEEAREIIFEPFRRLDDSSTGDHAGVGLGLSIVRQLAVLMGGVVTLTSELGQGSTFVVDFPL